ncbi:MULTISPECIES: nickel pincer cofactor biosynthesis protein LarC [Prochlorococcus]|uniref:Putative nickel insertion protein n=1 Tax=Prochlorococcus marinus (strain SARG / CCMP1375 / SS120) TaxID=167539 RepID=Q7VD97_PROMA|nr:MULTISPECIES: nickel pincer cofactor biosynthesis protein LarC [Prochlorococcus]AAP99531.1 Uncharacterized conserved protein [Prochlorococcus marinus subsp. marinus str. CCMP1375]KGG11196.1 hypothetical protein EV04_1271 [Prochlorococcus marinus str. LG]KGG21534.1 hypothetical protein EV08_0621 [Prochlorococcus marinus str. SS2]KGG23122.1 hypothetical protein EV09_1868 [Prochlorococcus marinus str. SS35]KGG33832.1 hypothetical protein EV10_0269 [Prochlorococcus marinus str. SS51]
MKSLFIDSSTGISGDMLLAAFLDLGVPFDAINAPLKLLGLDHSYSLRAEEAKSFDLRGLKVFVEDKELNHPNRHWVDIRTLIESSSLKKLLKEKVLKVFKLLAEAEASVHGIDADQVHFHELGSIDSLVDIIGVCAAVDYLEPRNIFCSFPPAGSGLVQAAHGYLPVPVPAVLQLAKAHKIKLVSDEASCGEVTTPTGLALLIVLADSFLRPKVLNINSIGIGLGHRKLQRPNLLRICLLESDSFTSSRLIEEELCWEEVIIQETWIDDSSPEDVSLLIDDLKRAGAIDVSSQSIQMKKGRTGVCLTAIVKPELAAKVRLIWFSFGTTIGLREKTEGRWVAKRRAGTCETVFGKVLVKQVRRPHGKVTIKVEHDELIRISTEKKLHIDEIRKEVLLSLDTFSPLEDWR